MSSPPDVPYQTLKDDTKQGQQTDASADLETGVQQAAEPIGVTILTVFVKRPPEPKKCGFALFITLLIIFAVARVVLFATYKTEAEKAEEDKMKNNLIVPDLPELYGNDWLADNFGAHCVVISHTTSAACNTKAHCTMLVEIQDAMFFNFLIGGDGKVYVGRGWDIKGGDHTNGQKLDCIGIAFIGNFMSELPPEKQMNAAKSVINEGITLSKLVKDYRLYGARQLSSTDSPGNALYEKIKTWPNWSSIVKMY